MSSFTITTPETSVNLRPSSVKPGETAQGTATYSVTNKTGATTRARVRVEPGDGADQSWFTVRDGDERDIAPGATVSYSIDLAVPGGSANHSFHAVVVNLGDPDNDFEAGSTIAFDAPAVVQGESGGKFPWWIIAVVVGLIILVGGGVAVYFFVIKDDGEVPPIEEPVGGGGVTPPEEQPGGNVPFHSLVHEDRIIAPDEFASYGIAEIRSAPSASYCPEAVAAITTRNKVGLTTGTQGNLRRCTAVPLSIEFANPVRSVTVEFYGSVEAYPLTAFDASGAEVASATKNGVLIYNDAPPAQVNVTSSAANIKRIVFGRDAHGTLIHAIRFE